MSQFKHESKAAPTAWQGTELRAVLRANGVSGHVTVCFDNDEGDTYSRDIAVADLPQDQQDCFTTLAGLMGGKVEAEGYEKDPHTRRKQEKEAAAEAERQEQERIKAEEQAARDAEKEKAKDRPVVDAPEVG